MLLLCFFLPVSLSRAQGVFYSPDSVTCDGKVHIQYTGTGSYDSLIWNWGNGARTTGLQSAYRYPVAGVYTITLYRYNGGNYDSVSRANYIHYTPSGLPLPSCVQGSSVYCCGYGISSFSLNGFTHNSTDGAEGFRDFSCLSLPDLAEGSPVSLQISSNTALPQDYRIWIDLNNNGTLEHPAELFFSADNSVSVSAPVTVPVASVYNTPLLMLISSDFSGSQPLPCSTPQFGQTELYRVRIVPAPDKPVAGFFSPEENQVSCNGFVSFTNTSLNNPAYYIWDFGDGTGSTLASPGHQYQQSGVFSVRLIAGNSAGTDTLVRNSYIHVALSPVCDTVLMPVSGSRVETYYCNGVIMDNGKKNNYSDNTNGTLVISPSFAENVKLTFTEFNFEPGFDFLYIYDGPNSSYPLIGKFSGTALPQGGVIQSTGPSLTLIQKTDDIYTLSGFTALMLCELGQEEAGIQPSIMLYPNPSAAYVFIKSELPLQKAEIISMQGQTVYLEQNPGTELDIRALSPGIYQVRLYTQAGVHFQKLIRN